jgi:predicted ATPase
MPAPLIRIKTEGFRAIGEADIIINGITVVAGENGCGKSTISKLLNCLYNTASNFDSLVSRELQYKLRNVHQFLDILQHELYVVSKDRHIREELSKELHLLIVNNDKTIAEQRKNWGSSINRLIDLYDDGQLNIFEEKKDLLRMNSRNYRLKRILNDVLKKKNNDDDESAPIQLDQVSSFVEEVFKEAEEKVKSRPTALFLQALSNVFTEGELPKAFDVMEFEEQIISLNKTSLSIPYSIQNAIYIDTPMMLGVSNSDNGHWDDLNELISKSGNSPFSKTFHAINREIIHGDISINDSSDFINDFLFKRDDGSIYNLLDCATGVKSFGILQLLLKNGSLSNKTLLIIDEPESHLHPQWIIEYAHLIVLLNKIVGVKFFIASHNPDMVSAIKHIAEKENIDDNLNFYIAEKRNNEYIYDYKHLGKEIDPIFASFNIALDRIHHYGS